MNMFHNAMVVKLRGYQEKYLLAVDDQESVIQGDNVSTKNVKWTVESVPGSDSLIRLKSCYGKYLTASDQPFLVGFTGFQVHQTLPGCLDSSIEWEPIRGGNQVVKLKNRRRGTFLRANNQLPPWRSSVTHKVPLRSSTNSCEWHVVIVATTEQSSFSTPEMYANQRVPAHAPAPAFAPAPATAPAAALASGQGFMQSANLILNTANLIVGATKLVTTFTNPGVSDAGNEPIGDTTGPSDAGNVDTGDVPERVDTGNSLGDGSGYVDTGNAMGDGSGYVDAGNTMGAGSEYVDAGNTMGDGAGLLDFFTGLLSS